MQQVEHDARATVRQGADETEAKNEREDFDREAQELPALARLAVETYIHSGTVIETPASLASPLLRERAACFVSIKTNEGDLRGCIGTIEPTNMSLAKELITNAISAATRDPRFFPVTSDELAGLRYSVDVLEPPEPARFENLSPDIYGVIVEDETGARRGLLLPNLEGVETACQQVEIAARKAGIPSDVPFRLHRFRVRRFREPSFDQ